MDEGAVITGIDVQASPIHHSIVVESPQRAGAEPECSDKCEDATFTISQEGDCCCGYVVAIRIGCSEGVVFTICHTGVDVEAHRATNINIGHSASMFITPYSGRRCRTRDCRTNRTARRPHRRNNTEETAECGTCQARELRK